MGNDSNLVCGVISMWLINIADLINADLVVNSLHAG